VSTTLRSNQRQHALHVKAHGPSKLGGDGDSSSSSACHYLHVRICGTSGSSQPTGPPRRFSSL